MKGEPMFPPKRSLSPTISHQEKPKGAKEQIFQAVLDGDIVEFDRIYNICRVSKKDSLQQVFGQIQEKFDELIYASMLNSSNNKEAMVAYLVSLCIAEQIAISSDDKKNYLRTPISPFREDAVGWMKDSLSNAAKQTRNFNIIELIDNLKVTESKSPSTVAQSSSGKWAGSSHSTSGASNHAEHLNSARAKDANSQHKK